jgi:hypothetical protein
METDRADLRPDEVRATTTQLEGSGAFGAWQQL